MPLGFAATIGLMAYAFSDKKLPAFLIDAGRPSADGIAVSEVDRQPVHWSYA